MGNHSPSVSHYRNYIGLFGITEMNERIKELAEQASLKLFDDTAQYRLLKGFAEKFAELIVRECGEYVGNKGMLAGGGCTVVGEEILMIADGLHKHFGVKE